MDTFPIIMIVLVALIVIVGIFAVFIAKQEQRPPDYFTFFLMGIIWLAIGFPLEMYPLSAMGLIFTVVGLLNRDKWEQNRRRWSDLSEGEKRLKLILVLVVGVTFLIGLAVFFWVRSM